MGIVTGKGYSLIMKYVGRLGPDTFKKLITIHGVIVTVKESDALRDVRLLV